MSEAYETMEVGRLLWGTVRDLLKLAKFRGHKIEWLESSGILSRIFTVKGDAKSVAIVTRAIKKTMEDFIAE